MLNRNEDLWPKSLKYNDKTFLFFNVSEEEWSTKENKWASV